MAETTLQIDETSGPVSPVDISTLQLDEQEAPGGPLGWKEVQEELVPGRKVLTGGAVTKRSKVPAIRYPSDDCILYLGRELDDDGEVKVEGTPYPVHEGEWVELQPILTVKAQLDLLKVQGDSSAESLVQLSEMLAGRIASWNWTDMDSAPRPIHPSADDVLDLSNDEWLYLIGLLSKGATGEQRKNA